jgi:hypothetical protein
VKVRRQLERLKEMTLGDLKDVKGAAWHEAPTGKWSLAQIVDHMARAIDTIVGAFEAQADVAPRPRHATPRQHLLRHLMLGANQLPSPRAISERNRPSDRPDPEMVTAAFRMAVERLTELTESWPAPKQEGLFVPHPVLGELNLPEWARFFYVRGLQYAHQIGVRRRWLGRRAS